MLQCLGSQTVGHDLVTDNNKYQQSFPRLPSVSPPLPYEPQEKRKEKNPESQHASWSFSRFLTGSSEKEKQKGHSVHDFIESQEQDLGSSESWKLNGSLPNVNQATCGHPWP